MLMPFDPSAIGFEKYFHNLLENLDHMPHKFTSEESAALQALQENSCPVYLLGKNHESGILTRSFDIAGLIDDNAATGSTWRGLTVVKMQEVPAQALVINCSTAIAPIAAKQALMKTGLTKILHVSALYKNNAAFIPQPDFVKKQRSHMQNHLNEWLSLYESLSDAESKKTLTDVIQFRLTGDPDYMQDYSLRMEQQYFENFMAYDQEVFVDAGGYDGETTQFFCSRYPNYRHVHFFEPSTKNFEFASGRLKHLPELTLHKKGLSDCSGSLRFKSGSGSASCVSDDGDDEIQVVTLDDAVPEPVTFIKMDLEGWEEYALKGCVQHIQRHAPKLAISVYHEARHFVELAKFVLSLQANYDLYLRHYTQGWSETIMYFKPRSTVRDYKLG